MIPCTPILRRAAAPVVVLAVIVSSHPWRPAPAGAADVLPGGHDAPAQVLSLPAPFECGTRWRGTTYRGHGRHDWNLDLNRAGSERGDDHGQPLLAQADGTVVWAVQTGYNNRAGTYVEIDYGDVTARYLHLVANSIPAEVAEVGARVRRGEMIGRLGDTGRASGPHLHLEYWDSSDHDDARVWELPRDRQLPVVFDGREMVATPSTPSPVAVSTNCPPRAPGLAVRPIWRSVWPFTRH